MPQLAASKIISSVFILIINLIIGMRSVWADVIMVDGNGMPSIVENDEFDQDVILMPGMSNGMIINDDMVLLG